jgi:hypothetical protein
MLAIVIARAGEGFAEFVIPGRRQRVRPSAGPMTGSAANPESSGIHSTVVAGFRVRGLSAHAPE